MQHKIFDYVSISHYTVARNLKNHLCTGWIIIFLWAKCWLILWTLGFVLVTQLFWKLKILY